MPPLQDLIRTQGPIPFAVFMEEALYGEGGYYSRVDVPIGEEGDYVTGTTLSPLFGRVTTRLLERLDKALGKTAAEMFEAGYGTGVHLENVVATLLEKTMGRRIRAWDRVARPVPVGVERVPSLEAIGEGEIQGLIFSYELFDALPIHRLVGRADGTVGELWVDLDPNGDQSGNFVWREGDVSDPSLPGLLRDTSLQPGQVADLSPGWEPLYRSLARRLGRGLLVTCDYGFEREKLLDPRIRANGTLACYTRQRVHRNPFVKVGEQDLTAHVDFTTLIQAGEAEGLHTVALTRQALWLTACGLFEELQGADAATRQGAMALLDGEGMGEEIRVLIQAKGIETDGLFEPGVLKGGT